MTNSSHTMPQLPFDMQIKILHRLPIKCLLRFRRVSKSWKFIIDNPFFIRDYGTSLCESFYLNIAYKRNSQGFMCSADDEMVWCFSRNTNLNLSALTPVTTSEGVWCFSYGSHMGAILWNPSIRKSIGILVPHMTSNPENRKIMWGFGVPTETFDPTFLNISIPFYGQGPWHVYVYSVNSNTWKNLENYRLPRVSIRLKRSCGQTTLNGFIYWGAYEIFFNFDGSCYNVTKFVSYDLINHIFYVLDIPDDLLEDLPNTYYISKLGNSIVISGNLVLYENQYLCAWLIEVNGETVISWSFLFCIPVENEVKLIGFNAHEDPIVEVLDGLMLHRLQVYNSPNQEFFDVGMSGDAGSFHVGPYKDSLLLLNA